MKHAIRMLLPLLACIILSQSAYCWGFYAHQKINYYAVFLLPPQMMVLYKPNISFLSEHAVDPDKRRYMVKEEGPRHFIDIDFYGKYPFDLLPHNRKQAVAKYSEDTLEAHGIVPWHILTMLQRLTDAFKEKNFAKIMKNSAEIGHYIADAHVPLHVCSNHNGQLTGQQGIHAFWESRVPELLAEKEWDFMIGKAVYIKDPSAYVWARVLESAKASDSVLRFEKELTAHFPADQKYSFEERNGKLIRQYSSAFTKAYDKKLNGMIERRMRLAISSVASFWYTAWVNAGEPNLEGLSKEKFSEADLKDFEKLNNDWNTGGKMLGREE
jgi:hypothetical protein